MPTKKAKSNIPPKKLEQYKKMINAFPSIEMKGATMPYTSINGHMFSFLDKEGMLGLRLPKEERAKFIDEHKTTLCEAHGTVLKEYVLVPDDLFVVIKKVEKYFSISIEYVTNLKPKSTKK